MICPTLRGIPEALGFGPETEAGIIAAGLVNGRDAGTGPLTLAMIRAR